MIVLKNGGGLGVLDSLGVFGYLGVLVLSFCFVVVCGSLGLILWFFLSC